MAEFLQWFALLSEEETALQELYKPLQQLLDPGRSDASGKFELSVRRSVDLEAWSGTGEGLIDRRKAGNFRGQGELAKAAHQSLLKSLQGDLPDALQSAAEEFFTRFGATPAAIDDLLLSHATRQQFYDWFFSLDYVEVTYGLKYDKTELEYLSPGARGIVLLVLYLEMDKDDRRPLIIDQPEGNLDNSSIYDSLVPYLRAAKQKRQIILVTHNPNLVVTTDAEQVIVATAQKTGGRAYPTISYRAGSLEDCGAPDRTRETVCRLLEGGETAFLKREEKYGLMT